MLGEDRSTVDQVPEVLLHLYSTKREKWKKGFEKSSTKERRKTSELALEEDRQSW